MKKVKFLFMALTAVSLFFASCSSDEPKKTVVVTPTDTNLEEIPDISAPAATQVTIAIRIPSGTECDGIALRGTNDNWTTQGILGNFTKVSGTTTWYSVTVDLGTAGFFAKACLLPATDANWATQWATSGLEILKGTESAALVDDYGSLNKLNVTAGGSVIYLNVSGWASTPCVQDQSYSISLVVPSCTPSTADTAYIIGSFTGSEWSTPIALLKQTNGTYTGTITAQPGAQYKYKLSKSDWSNEEGTLDATGVFTSRGVNRVIGSAVAVKDTVSAWTSCATLIQ